MRILHITAQKPDSTGSGTYLAQLVAALGRAGHTQAVVCGIDVADQPQLPSEVAVFPVRFGAQQPDADVPFPVCGMSDEMPYESTRYRDMTPAMVDQFSRAFSRVVREATAALQPDAVICNHLYLLTALVRQTLPEVPVYGICHSTCLRQMKSHQLQRDFIRGGIQGLDGVFALHDQQVQLIQEVFDLPRERIGVIGTGYNAAEFNRGPQDQPATSRATDLAYVGKISYKKGVASLMRALDLIPAQNQPLEVHLIGGAGNQQELQHITQLVADSPHKVRLLGKVDQDVLVEEYRSARTFVLPSFYEGLPLVTIEAMACGCNVVVTDLPGVRPWLEANVPDAPVDYVTLPDMEGVDQPVLDQLPAFERRLAQALETSLQRPPCQTEVTHLSWDALAQRVLGYLPQ